MVYRVILSLLYRERATVIGNVKKILFYTWLDKWISGYMDGRVPFFQDLVIYLKPLHHFFE